MSLMKRRFEEYRDEFEMASELIRRIQDALGTAETGDALIEVARNAHRAERAYVRIVCELDEVRNELEEDFDITDGGGPNKAMRLANMIDEAIYGPGGY